MEGIDVQCLLDSGSQVTIVSEKFYKERLSHIPLQHLQTPVTVTGAGGQSVPYSGIISVTCTLPENVAGKIQSVQVAALIGGDSPLSARLPMILGTNAFKKLKPLKFTEQLVKGEAVFMMAHQLDRSHESGKLGQIQLLGRGVTVPPFGTVCVKGKPQVNTIRTCAGVLLQEPTEAEFPEGLHVVAAKVGVDDLCGVQVTLCNMTDHDVELKRKDIIADVFMIQSIYNISNVLAEFHDVQQLPVSATTKDSKANHPVSVETGSSNDLNFKFGENTTPEWREHFTRRLYEFNDVFIHNELDLGLTTEVSHDVKLNAGAWVKERPRPIPPKDFAEAKQHIQELLDAKIIKPSSSPYASPIVLVRKKSGALRMCIDYRKINAHTIKDSYAIPKIEDMFLTLSGAKFFTSMDLSRAYYQVPLTERAKLISAFTTPFGLYQFERMPMGLKNAPPTFQRLMEKVFADMNLTELIVFLDDILMHGRTLEELEERTIQALHRLRRFNLKLDPDKCVFGTSEVRHLGHVITDKGIKPDPDKIKTLINWPLPRTVRDVKSFIGFAGYYRRFIPNFAQVSRPLHDLTIGYMPKGSQKKEQYSKTNHPSSDI